ncbi:MAG: hypothetical protein ABL906_01285 [Sideroxydans sp.]
MNRPQYLALCIIGVIAVMAYIQAHEVAKAMQSGGFIKKPQTITV